MPLTASEARSPFHSQLPPVPPRFTPYPLGPQCPSPKSTALRGKLVARTRRGGRSTTSLPQCLGPGGASSSPDAAPALPKRTPLTESEARLLIQSKLQPSFSSPSSRLRAATVRAPMPQSEINRLAWKIGRENTLQRTLHYIPAHINPDSATPDQRILHAHRRKSYTAPSNKFDHDTTPLW
ncbi:hypothetical protein MSAN_00078500 [Mycena sanguinolenta]|uniref:Uncharacterized protein n=1 Tax=Mycena sanguinolenta TaxID=230812 RepID=A0A8H7DKD5_9AGAR|nr:hypothetical protein MSAN_00078500 [Mycena sanguinolenta]